MLGRVAAWFVGAAIVGLYLYVVISALGNLIGISELAGVLGLSLTPVGWFWLLLGIVLPLVALGCSLLLGRGRRAGTRLLLLATGVCVVAALQLEILHLVPQSSFFA